MFAQTFRLKLFAGLYAGLFLLVWPWAAGQAQPLELDGQWFRAPPDWIYTGQSKLDDAKLVPVDRLSLTGGHFVYQADFDIQNQALVLDFKNTSVIGLFNHRIFDRQGRLIEESKGGIQSGETAQFWLRHGRELNLPPGRYRLITELTSPFLLAQPQLYLDSRQDYRQAINSGNALTLACVGILFSLVFYYGVLSIVRRNLVDGMYSMFILSNLLYNMTALLIFSQLFELHWFYLISAPFLLFGNWAYVLFVIGLLGIQRAKQPRLYGAGMMLMGFFAIFALLALFKPNWSLELVRVAVGLYLTYGLICGVVRARDGSQTARFYLIAIGVFFAAGMTAISLSRVEGVYTFYVEHLGLLSITVEAMLLSFVLAQQFSQLHKEKEPALFVSMQNLHAASTDALTGLPNRFALISELQQLPERGSLTFIDLDGLKHYNDFFGHEHGDELLCSFGRLLQQQLPEGARLHRLGGDEFAITHPQGDFHEIENMLSVTVEGLRSAGFELAGASFGLVYVFENPSKDRLMHMADERMYQCKRARKDAIA